MEVRQLLPSVCKRSPVWTAVTKQCAQTPRSLRPWTGAATKPRRWKPSWPQTGQRSPVPRERRGEDLGREIRISSQRAEQLLRPCGHAIPHRVPGGAEAGPTEKCSHASHLPFAQLCPTLNADPGTQAHRPAAQGFFQTGHVGLSTKNPVS